MSAFVLVHGAWHGGWCWERVTPLLERAGHVVSAPDLPGHGNDRTPIADVTLERYVHRIEETTESLGEPVILVGHSMGGIVLSQLAEAHPEKARVLVFVAAYLLRDGQSVLDIAAADSDASLLPCLEWAPDGLSASVPPQAARTVFYGECSEIDAAAASARLVPQSATPVTTPIHVSDVRFGRVPRAYVECLRDRVVSPAAQRAMYAATPCARIASLASDHSPFYSAPTALVDILLSFAS
jgi:pimeloyl-ACP methyl ester carboxylesterase